MQGLILAAFFGVSDDSSYNQLIHMKKRMTIFCPYLRQMFLKILMKLFGEEDEK